MLNRLFSFDSPFMRDMSRIFDTTELNLLWLLCCVPVVTIGPSTAAFHGAMLDLVRGEESKVHRDFFACFFRNFKKNVLVGLILLITGVFLWLDVYLAYRAGKGIYTFFMVFFSVLFLILIMVSLYTFPLLAKAKQGDTVLKTLALAFVLAIRRFHYSLLLLLSLAFNLWLCHLAPVFLFFGFGLLVEFQSTLLSTTLKPYQDSTPVDSCASQEPQA